MTERELEPQEALEAPEPLPGRDDYFYSGPGEVKWERSAPTKTPDLSEPDLTDPHPRATGKELFEALTKPEQDALLGAEKADLIRSGKAELADFVMRQESPAPKEDDFITEKPLKDVTDN